MALGKEQRTAPLALAVDAALAREPQDLPGALEGDRRLLPRDVRTERRPPVPNRRLELVPSRGRGNQRDVEGREMCHERVRTEADRQAVRPLAALVGFDHHHRHAPRQAPGGIRGRRLHRRGRRGWVLHQQRGKALTPAVEHAGGRRLLARVALDRVGGQLVDVGEDRFGQRVQGARRQPGPLACGREPPPGHPGSEPVGRQQRVQAPPRPHLAAAEVQVHLTVRVRIRLRIGHEAGEARERLLDSGPERLSERPLERARVVGNPATQLGDDLVGERGQLGAEHIGHLRRQPGPRMLGNRLLESYKNCVSDRGD
ncbi:MAG: hypothetical protein ABW142_08545 [Thermoleophilaceae bacterium]